MILERTLMEFLLLALCILIGILILLLLKRSILPTPAATDQTILLLQQNLESLRTDLRTSLQHITETVNLQLSGVARQMQTQTEAVGSRLDHATRVIGDVQQNLGRLEQSAQEMKELGHNVTKLEELLSAPKLRGGLGEYLLEDLLKQVLPANSFQMQYQFRNGQTVDAVIRTSDRLAPIDSKFPLENFRRIISSECDDDRRTHQRSFVADVKRHIDAIATKYILPDEGTFPFALMYIPAENIYYEVIVKEDGVTNGAGLYEYAIERKVIPVSPNSFYAYLQVIALGLRGLCIEESAREIVNTLVRLLGDMARVREVFDTLGSHLDHAHKKFDEVDKRLSSFEGKLENVAGPQLSQPQSSLPVPGGDPLLSEESILIS